MEKVFAAGTDGKDHFLDDVNEHLTIKNSEQQVDAEGSYEHEDL